MGLDKGCPHRAALLCAVALVATLVAPSGAQTPAPVPRLAVGELFPEIELPSLEDGSPGSLRQFRGHKVILHIFASW